jgi:hypothetical protein
MFPDYLSVPSSGIQKHVTFDKTIYNLFTIPMGTQKNFFIDNFGVHPQNVSPALH